MELIKANRDETVLIKEAAKYCIHVRLTKTNYNPTNPQINSTNERIAVFTPKEFELMEAQIHARQAYNWVAVAGYDKAYVVHDGRLVAKEETPKAEEPKPKTVDELVNELADKKAKEIVTKEHRAKALRKSFAKKPSDG